MIKTYQHNDDHFKENRLVFMADDTKKTNTANTADEDKEKPKDKAKTEDTKKAEKKQAEAQKMKDLEKKVKQSNLNKETQKLAVAALNSEDEDEVALVEKLMSGTISMSQSKFKSELNKLREKKRKTEPIKAASSDVKSKTGSLLVDKLKSHIPEMGNEKKHFGDTVDRMGNLNISEKKIVDGISERLNKHVTDGAITKENAEEVANMDPRHQLARERIKELLGPLAKKDKELLHTIIAEKAKQQKVVDEFERLWGEAEKLIEKEMGPLKAAKRKHEQLSFLSRIAGVRLREGMELNYIGLDKNLKGTPKRATIDKIEFKAYEPTFLRPQDLDAEYKAMLEAEKPTAPNSLVITMSYELPSGELVTRTFPEDKFLMWVNQNQSVEVFNDHEDLENRLGFTEFGQKITEGMKLDYIMGRDEARNPKIETVQIKKLDKARQVIKLDKPVLIMSKLERHDDPDVGAKSYKDELTYGEFAKWFFRTRAEEKMNLKRAQEVLRAHPKVLKTRYPGIPKHIWEFNDVPIQLKEGEELIYGNSKKIRINKAKPDSIELSNGMKFSPGQFVRFVKEYEIERADKLPEKDDVKKAVKEAIHDDDSSKKTNEISEKAGSDRVGMLYGIWQNTTFLSLKDIWMFIDTTIEYVKRKHDRNVKRRAGKVGQNLPGRLGAEFRNLQEQAEHEEVNKYKEEMADLDVWIIKDRLHATRDQDEAKAAMILLSEKGLLDFEDHKIWETLNRIMKKTLPPGQYETYRIDPKSKKSQYGEVGPDAMKTAIDQIWGQPTGTDWYNTNDSTYNSEVEKARNDANDYENDYKGVGGVASELHNMLVRHMKGQFVSPHRFESFIKFIIDAGKAEIEDKFYYLIAGCTVENPRGETIFSKQRHASIEGKYLNRLPHLDILTRYSPIPGEGAFPKTFCSMLMEDWGVVPGLNMGPAKNRYNKGKVRAFIWENIMANRVVHTRLNKGTRNADAMDHDDAHAFIPMADENLIVQSVVSNYRGDRSAFTVEGLKNGFAGYTHYMASIANVAMRYSDAEIEHRDKVDNFEPPEVLMRKTIKSFVAFESITNKRNYYEKNWQRIGDDVWRTKPIVDSEKTTGDHMKEMRGVVEKVLRAYDMKETDIQDFLYKGYWDKKDTSEAKAHQTKMGTFGREFERLVSKDGGEKMIGVVTDAVKSGELQGFAGEDMTTDTEELKKRGIDVESGSN